MGYLIDHYKGRWRLRVEYDQNTNQFVRELNGNFSDIDVYIDGQAAKVYYYGSSILEAYIDSLGRGRNIVKNIYSDLIGDLNKYIKVQESTSKEGEIKTTNIFNYKELYQDKELNKLIFDIQESDEELTFKFKANKIDMLEKYFKFKTSAADRSPFSTKNLPKSNYSIPDEDLLAYKNIISKLPKEHVLKIGHITNEFIQSLVNKKNTIENIKNDMKLKCLKNKEYIHSINKWQDYIKYLKQEVDNICNT